MKSPEIPLSPGQLATLACCLEVTIPKPGNVHRGADFPDTTFSDFLVSAIAIGPVMDEARKGPLGETIYQCIERTRQVVRANTNLGLVLLLAPLAAAPRLDQQAVSELLEATTAEDCQRVYDAIQLAQPGGMGRVSEWDVHNSLTDQFSGCLVDAMRLAKDRDLIARQYTNGLQEIFGFVVPSLEAGWQRGLALEDVVIHTFLQLVHQWPDSLIARKCGLKVARQAAAGAGRVLSAGAPGEPEYLRQLADLDFWMRSDGNRRNPGTSADMIGAGLFVCLSKGTIQMPLNRPPS